MHEIKFPISHTKNSALQELCDFADLIAEGKKIKIRIAQKSIDKIRKAAQLVKQKSKLNSPIYGINTGCGNFANVAIHKQNLSKFQHNIIKSHCCGIGDELPRSTIALMWLLRLNTFCLGHSGIQEKTINTIITLLEHGVLGCVPSRGSVGASGDLAPAAHASLVLLGLGKCTIKKQNKIRTISANRALSLCSLNKLTLEPKEGLSLINGTHLTTSLSIQAHNAGMHLYNLANLAASLSFIGLRADTTLLKTHVLKTHRHNGTFQAGTAMRKWLSLKDSTCTKNIRAQDPYSLRCTPQTHGVIKETLEYAEKVLLQEINAAQDNPLVFTNKQEIISCGNFLAIYPAKVADMLSSTFNNLATISERRINQAMDTKHSGLPEFLIQEKGINSGMMMLQVTAAALASECKTLAIPASIDTIPTSCDQEDYVSMGPIAGFKALKTAELAKNVLALELLTASQAIALLKTKKLPPKLAHIYKIIRKQILPLIKDRVLYQDITSILKIVEQLQLEGTI